METRTNKRWFNRSGVYDSINIRYCDSSVDYPILSSIINLNNFKVVICNDYKQISEYSLVSTFVDDYILERFWNNPPKYINYFKNSLSVMSPDFSILVGMPKPVQIWNTYRNRLIGSIWQKEGLNVIPTVSWSDSSSFDFCFNGIGYNSNVAISNIGCRNEKDKDFFDAGFNEMKKRINPNQIIFQCNKKYKDNYSDNNIIFIDSFWDNKRKLKDGR